MIESLISALGLELGLTSKEIADVVWLALQMNEVDRLPELVPDRSEKVQPTPQPKPSTEPSFQNSERQERSEPQPSEPQAGLYAPDYQDSASMAGALALKVPDARSMREPLSLARALKPLLRKVMTGYRMVLDEAATVERIAEEGVWLPVLQPSLEPWLELALVVDESVSMQIWRRTIVELHRFMEHYGVFRDVRVWGLLTDEQGQVQIRPGMGKAAMWQGLRRPSELIDPSGRRLILVVTDCVSPLWRDGTIQPALKRWSSSGPMAIVQMLPEWLWARTGLSLASTVRFQTRLAGLANQQLRVRDLSPWDDVDVETGIKVPVVTLEPERFGAWAEMMTGKGGAWATGVIFESAASAVDLLLRQDEALDGVQRVQQFRVTASPMARQLTGLLAAAPVISLPIVRIIQERLLKDSRQVHVAEVFLGGLLKPLVEITPETNVDSVQYEFLDGVRDVLLESMRTSQTINVLNEVSQFVANRLGLSIDAFMAVLRSPHQIEDQELVGNVSPFALVTGQILRNLGGEYTVFSEELQEQFRKQQQSNIEYLYEKTVDFTQHRVKRQQPELVQNIQDTEQFKVIPNLSLILEPESTVPEPETQSLERDTEQFKALSRLSLILEPKNVVPEPETQSLGILIRRYPYLYPHCLVTKRSTVNEQQDIRTLQLNIQNRYELKLSKFVIYLVRKSIRSRQSQNSQIHYAVPNPTLLDEPQLCAALKQFSGKVRNGLTHKNLANRFLLHNKDQKSFRNFKDDLYEYLIDAVEPEYGRRQFNNQLYQQLQMILPDSDQSDFNEFLLLRTCSQLLNFLIVQKPNYPNHFVFVDMLSNLGPINTISLLLKVILICRKAKPYLEKRFAILFDHYENHPQNSVQWLVMAMEHLNIALSSNFGSMNLTLVDSLN